MTRLSEKFHVIDVDAHVMEPPDLWTSRLGQKWDVEDVPHVKRDSVTGEDVWFVGGQRELTAGLSAMAGHDEYFPDHPLTYDDFDPGAWQPKARLAWMDKMGVYAQVLYPNVGGFGSGSYGRIKDLELRMDCIRAYNDFIAEFAGEDAKRLVPTTAIPFWDVEEAVRELKRANALGHRGVMVSSQPEQFGEPVLADPHWDPVWRTAQELGVPVCFHVGSGDRAFRTHGFAPNGAHANMAKASSLSFMANANAVAEIIVSGMCHRFPDVNFISVESGIGWIPFLLESLDWQWKNGGVWKEHAEYELLPSEYFRRQIYGCFWFEKEISPEVIDRLGSGHILYETDYPHPTSMSPGPASFADKPSDFLETNYSGWTADTARRILHDNAAALYGLD
jgi:uncharacterized protein